MWFMIAWAVASIIAVFMMNWTADKLDKEIEEIKWRDRNN